MSHCYSFSASPLCPHPPAPRVKALSGVQISLPSQSWPQSSTSFPDPEILQGPMASPCQEATGATPRGHSFPLYPKGRWCPSVPSEGWGGPSPPEPRSYLVQEAQLLSRLRIQNLHLKKEHSLFMLLRLGGRGPGEAIKAKARAKALVGVPGHNTQAEVHAATTSPAHRTAAPAADRQSPPLTSPREGNGSEPGDQILPWCWKGARACPGTASCNARRNPSGTTWLYIKLSSGGGWSQPPGARMP
jgi:hypothetical protein